MLQNGNPLNDHTLVPIKSDGDNNHCGTPSRKRSFVEGLEEIMPSPQDYKEKVIKFSDLTTAHGWKRAAIAKSEISKSFWILLLIALVGMFLFQAYTLTDKFRKHETITGISVGIMILRGLSENLMISRFGNRVT